MTYTRNAAANGDDEDPLGAFFEEVSAAEEEAKKENEHQANGTGAKLQDDHEASQGDLALPAKKKARISVASPATSTDATPSTSAIVVKKVAAAKFSCAQGLTPYDASADAVLSPPPPPPPPLPEEQAEADASASERRDQSAAGAIVPPPPPPPPLPPLLGVGPPLPPGDPHSSHHPGGCPVPPQEQSLQKSFKRSAAGKTWEDPSLSEFPPDDFRLFVGNLAKDIKRDQLLQHFQSRYRSVVMAKIVYDKNNNKSKGYGFVSFMEPMEAARAMREMNETFLGSRPIKVKRSEWKDRDLGRVRKQQKKEKKRKGYGGGYGSWS